ncbi:MAG: glycosyltransferase family 4 protein [Gemmatimonadetes bacterium]|nr:glycosyltransferase family 4 protein [Gemmatimonadota bacterium]
MRILMQCIYFPPEVGGLESHVYTLCRELVRRGERVRMITSRSRPGLRRRETMDGIEVHRVWMPARRPAGWVAHAVATAPLHRRLAADADLFHAQTFAAAPPAWPSQRRYRRPLVLSLHTSHFLLRARRPLWRPILRRIIASADAVFTASREILEVALSLYPHPRAEVLLNAVDTEAFCPGAGVLPATDRPRVVVPRRLFPKNGVEYFVRAMPLIVRHRDDVEAVVVGDGPEFERLQRLARELCVADRVRFLGSKAHAEMPAFLRSAHLVVIPSLMEASSVAALEAMACGVPVAASRVGGLPEIIDDGVGALFDPGRPESIAEAVVALLADPAGLARKGEAARQQVVEGFSLARLVDRHLEVYRQLLGERGERGERRG